jgi:hypothetical protein
MPPPKLLATGQRAIPRRDGVQREPWSYFFDQLTARIQVLAGADYSQF